MRRYSKAPEHAYDLALRNDVLAAARAEHGEEIRRGMRWFATGRMSVSDLFHLVT